LVSVHSVIILLRDFTSFTVQIRAAEDHKKIAFLLSLSRMTEHDIVYLSSLPRHRVVPPVEQSQFTHSVRDVNGKFLICFQYL
jgi:hypothetical protein